MLQGTPNVVHYIGCVGNDDNGRHLKEAAGTHAVKAQLPEQ
jgi:hypothetical protein